MLFCNRVEGRSWPSFLELLLEFLDLLIDAFGSHGNFLPGQELSEELGIDQRVDTLTIDGLPVFSRRDRIPTEEREYLSLGDFVRMPVVRDSGDHIGQSGTTDGSAPPLLGAAGGAVWARASPRVANPTAINVNKPLTTVLNI